ncbi:MAG: glycosyltransferase [Anaerolineales bacterium]|nr:glycosyltransferase [Anaerolineales bacterium]
MNTPIDVILPTRNRSELIAPTLESLRANTYPDFQVWVVDQSPGPETAQVVQRFVAQDPRFHLLSTNAQGVDKARNHGLYQTSAPLVAFTDDDCRVAPDWLTNLAAEYAQDPQPWSVFGRVVPGSAQPGPMSPQTPRDPAAERLAQVLPMAMKQDMERKIYQNNRFDLGFGHGANMSFARKTFERVGWFDDLLGTGAPLRSWPERDFGYRILKAGGQIVYTPHAMVYHYHWRAWAGVKATYRNYAFGTGAVVGKYLRCGDWGGLYLMGEWLLDQGVRQVFSGLLKWRSWQKMYVGWLQMVYPWFGLIAGFRYRVDRQGIVYLED